MLREITALFLLSIFVSYSFLPTIISLVDKDVEIIFFMDFNEEESKEKESSKDSDIKILDLINTNLAFDDYNSDTLAGYYLKKYAKAYLNILSPPPEINIL